MTEPLRNPRRPVPALALALALAWLPAGLAPASAQEQTSAAGETAGGLHTVRFHTSAGEVTVYLPDDIAAGDTLSGTVSFSPAGKTDAERETNLGTLRGDVVEVAGQPVPEGSGWWAKIPEAAGPLVVRLRGAGESRLGEVPIPVAPSPPEPPAGFGIPSYGQAGRSLPIPGPFGETGGGTGAHVEIGGREAPVLAQSPRQTIVLVPNDLAGPVHLRVEQGSTAAEGEVRILAVQLTADRVHLQRGERTTLHVEVRGLEGLSEPIPLHLTNESPQVVRLDRGDTQTVTIRPADVPPSGVLRLDRAIQSRRTGDFSITTALARPLYLTIEPQPVPIQAAGCDCKTLTLTPDAKLMKADFDAATKKLTVTLAYATDISCQGRPRGNCEGELTVESVVGTDWLVRSPPGGLSWPGDNTPVEGAKITRTITGKCGARPSHETKTVDSVLDLSQLNLKANFDKVSGRITFNFKTSCNGKDNSSKLTLRVDTTIPAGDNQPQGIDLELSDLDGDGQPDYLCVCRDLEVTLDARKATVELSKQGTRWILALTVPYEAKIPCESPLGKEDACSAKVVVSPTESLTWLPPPAPPAQTAGIPGFPPSYSPTEITCSGICERRARPESQKGTLAYNAVLFDSGRTHLSGTLELTFDATATCGKGAKQTFQAEIDIDTTKQNGKVTITKNGD
jgi:hypothetical protein